MTDVSASSSPRWRLLRPLLALAAIPPVIAAGVVGWWLVLEDGGQNGLWHVVDTLCVANQDRRG